MTVSNCNSGKGERNPHVLSLLSSAVAVLQGAEEPENACDILSKELTAGGVQHVVLACEDSSYKVARVLLPSPVVDTAEKGLGTSLKGREFAVEDLPSQKSEDVFFVEPDEVLSPILGCSLSALGDTYTPRTAVVMSLVQHVLVLLSDELTERELPLLSVLKKILEAALVNTSLSEKVKKQKEFSERIIKSVHEGIMMEDSEGKITFVNPRLQQILGFTEDELVGCHYSRIAHPEFIKQVEEESRKRPRGIPGKYEACLVRKDGESVPVIVSATPLFEDHVYTGTLTMFTDISLQKKAEDEIRILKEFSENVIQSMHEAVIIEDARGIITFGNKRLEELLERASDDIMGHHWSEFTAPEYLQKVEEESARRSHGVSGQYEAALLTKSGRRVPIMVGSTPLFENGTFCGVISVCVDLTVIKEKEKEIKQMNEDLQLLSKINHALNVGEDLKTILDMAVQEIQKIFNSGTVAIMFVENDGSTIRCENSAVSPEVGRVLDSDQMPPTSFPIQKGSILEKAVREGESCLVHGRTEEVFKGIVSSEVLVKIQEHAQIKSATVLPLLVEDEVIGVIVLGSPQEFSQNDFIRLKSLSRHLALAIEHAQLDETFHLTSEELQTHLREQTLLREIVEKLYMAANRDEVIDIVSEGLKSLGYNYFGLTLKEDKYARLMLAEPKDLLKRVTKVVQKTGALPSLERIQLPEKYIFKKGQKKRGALVTDNVVLLKEKNVISLPMRDFVEVWVGRDRNLQDQVIEALGVQSLICIPFQVADEFMGAFVVGSEDVLTLHDFVVLETLGQIISQALGKLQYSEALEKKSRDLEFSNRRLSLLQEINNALNSTMDLGEILKILVRGISSIFGYTIPSVYLLSEDQKYLLVKEFDIDSRLLEGIIRLVGFNLDQYRIPLFEGSQLKKVIDEKKPLVTSDIPRFLEDYTEEATLRRLAGALYRMGNVNWVTAIPLLAGDEPVGMLVFGSKWKIEQEDIDALSGFLDQTVLAIHKARMYTQLAEANQMKSEFIDIASHELRTPLTSMKLYLEMMKIGRYGELAPELDEKVGLLQASVERLRRIIDQTLVSSEIYGEKLDLAKEKISLVEVIKEVVTQLTPVWEKKKQRIDIQGPYELPLVHADRDSMWEVINALLDNALKYSPDESRVIVKVYDRPEEVEVAVIDEGIGIQPEYLPKIFEMFYIVPSDSEYARQDGRTGLGLYNAKGIVEGHGGKIWVESVYGLGSTFHFTLPK